MPEIENFSQENAGELLRQYRVKQHITQTDLGKVLGVPQSLISRWELGRSPIQPMHLPGIAELLGSSDVVADIEPLPDPTASVSRPRSRAVQPPDFDAAIRYAATTEGGTHTTPLSVAARSLMREMHQAEGADLLTMHKTLIGSLCTASLRPPTVVNEYALTTLRARRRMVRRVTAEPLITDGDLLIFGMNALEGEMRLGKTIYDELITWHALISSLRDEVQGTASPLFNDQEAGTIMKAVGF